MSLEAWITAAKGHRASDLHLEPGLPPMVRVDGRLMPLGQPVGAHALLDAARGAIGEGHWPTFLARRSFDLSAVVAGTRVRINVLKSARGVGMAVRLLSSFRPTLASLNLHPDLAALASAPHGLILICGATGSGKSTTLAALIHDLASKEARHVVTIEAPIEYALPSRRSLIRQREVGRDTPSFEQGLLDCLREDPDVIVVGEMREPEVMRLTLNAAETGHLVFATMHSSSCIEAIQRVISAFPAEMQASVAAQLADALQAVICQRLIFDEARGLRLPVCEIAVATHAVKGLIRKGEPFRIAQSIETGRDDGMWTFERYQRWLDGRTNLVVPARGGGAAGPDELPAAEVDLGPPPLARPRAATSPSPVIDAPTTPELPATTTLPVGIAGGEVDDLISQLQRGPRKKG